MVGSLSRTEINLGIISGRARVGFKVAGVGEPQISYRSIFNGAPISSVRQRNGRSRTAHNIKWSSDQVESFETTLAYKGDPGQWPYGWRLSNPRFDWRVTVTPGVKGNIDITVWPLNERVVIGPYWLDVFTVNLGTLRLQTHDGTVPEIQMQPGRRIHG